MKTALIFLFSFCLFSVSIAQDTLVIGKNTNQLKFIPLPIIGSNPTYGWMFGVAPSATWYLGDESNTSISSALGSVIYTTNDQLITTAKASTFFAGNRWNMLTDIRYFVSSQPTYGLGTGPQSSKPVGTGFAEYTDNPYEPIGTDQMMEFDFFRFHNTLMKRHGSTPLYYGIGYHFDYHANIQDNLLDLEGDTAILTSHYAYSDFHGYDPTEYILSGFSLNIQYDSRDNSVNPYSGRFAYINLRINPEFMGSSKKSTILWIEYRDYIHLSESRPRHLIGFWTYGNFVTSGNVPYLDLPAVGWDQFGRSGRAYTQGRFRGQNLVYGEIEYRVPLQRNKERFGAVAFMNGTTASNTDGDISLFQYVDVGYGVGLRILVDKKSRANLNIDYAIGKYGAHGFYIGINEVF